MTGPETGPILKLPTLIRSVPSSREGDEENRRELVAVALCAIGPGLSAQPSIDHAALECIAPGQFAVVLSGIDPGEELQTAKVYFRSSLYPDFYYVEMTYEEGRYVGILPQVSPETPRVVYYLEAIDSVFNSTRSHEFDPPVKDPCDDDPAAAYLLGANPGIVVGVTTAAQSALPPGFSAVGIIGTITAAGASAGVGGGVSTGVVVAAAAGAAGVAGGVVATQPEEEPAMTTAIADAPPPEATTSVAPTTTVGTTSTVLPGQTTTTVVTTTTTPGPSTTTAPGPSTTTTAPALNPECFTVQVLGECQVRLDATCVNLPVDRYEWVLDQGNKWQVVNISNGAPSFVYTWGSCDDDDENIVFRLTVHRGPTSASAMKSRNVTGGDLRSPASQPITLQTQLALPPFDGSARGRLIFEGAAARMVDSSHSAELSVPAAAGMRRVEAVVTRAGAGPGEWRFDFSRESRFVQGSLRAVQGNVLAVETSTIVFRVTGQAQERLSFTFELAP